MKRKRTFPLREGELEYGGSFFVISGPCVIESQSHCLEMANQLKGHSEKLQIPLIFKASFDKANRTSINSYRGPGMDAGLEILETVRRKIGIPVTTDIHLPHQAKPVGRVVDILQIPAFLCRQTDLLVAAGSTGCTVNIKKGQFLAPWEIEYAVRKVEEAGPSRVLVTERGTVFGYNNLVVDFKSIPIMQSLGCPVVFDATHSVQLPGGAGSSSGGQPEFIFPLASAAVAAGADGVFFEVHDRPDQALSDGANALQIDLVPRLLERLRAIKEALHTLSPLLSNSAQ